MRPLRFQYSRLKIEPLQIFQSSHQPFSGCGLWANLELSQPYEARDATIHRILQQVSQILAQGWRDAMGDKIVDPALGLNQRIGAKALDRRGAGKDRAGGATPRNEAQGEVLVRWGRPGLRDAPCSERPCAPPTKEETAE